jgi:DNA polymerase III subunit epsilon
MHRQIFLDTETTGLSAADGDRVVEIGCIEMVNRRVTGRHLHHYVNPERPSHPDAVKVHGLTDEFLADKPVFATIADDVIEFLRDAEVVIHNAAFDVGFLNEELRRLGRPRVAEIVGQVTDSLLMAREMFPGKANSLDALCRRLEVDNTSRTLHGALLDAGLLAEVYIRLTQGQESLAIDDSEVTRASDGLVVDRVELIAYVLPVPAPSPEEEAAHELALTDLDVASEGKTVWRWAMA